MRGEFRITKSNREQTPFLVIGYINGRRVRQYCRTKGEAEVALERKVIELQNHGHALASIPNELRVAALSCTERLAPFGVTITQVTDWWLGQHDWRKKSVLVKDAVNLYHPELARLHQANEIGLRMYRDTKQTVNRLAKDFASTQLCDLTGQVLTQWLISKPIGPKRRNNIRAYLSVFFNRFVLPQGWVKESPVPAVQKANTKRLKKKPCIYTPLQAAAILSAAEEFTPYFAIALFAGLRTSELERLDWRQIDFEERLIDVETTKTHKERYVPMSDNLIAWLAPYRQAQGRVLPVMNPETRARIRDRAGIPEQGMDNAARHSFCSYYYALKKDLGECAKDAGNSPTVFETNYNHRVKESEARTWFAIMPQEAQNIINVA